MVNLSSSRLIENWLVLAKLTYIRPYILVFATVFVMVSMLILFVIFTNDTRITNPFVWCFGTKTDPCAQFAGLCVSSNNWSWAVDALKKMMPPAPVTFFGHT